MLRQSYKRKHLLPILETVGSIIFSPRLLYKNKRKSNANGKIENILVLELWGLGDLVMATPCLKILKDSFPDAEITLLAQAHANTLFEDMDTVDKIIPFKMPWTKFSGKYNFFKWNWPALFALIKSIRKTDYDLIIDARGDIRNNLLTFMLGGKRRVGFDWTGGGYLLDDVVKCDYRNIHRVDAWMELMDHLKLNTKQRVPTLDVTEDASYKAKEFIRQNKIDASGPLIGIHPGARIKTRCWPLEKFAKVADFVRNKYKANLLVFVEPEGYGSQIAIDGDFTKVQVSLKEMIAIIRQLDIFICNDGGAMHIASALGVPVIAVFGPTEPTWFGPIDSNCDIVIDTSVTCRPCFDYCIYTKPLCIEKITVEQVCSVIESKMPGIITGKQCTI